MEEVSYPGTEGLRALVLNTWWVLLVENMITEPRCLFDFSFQPSSPIMGIMGMFYAILFEIWSWRSILCSRQMASGVVVVTINYRLSTLGFLRCWEKTIARCADFFLIGCCCVFTIPPTAWALKRCLEIWGCWTRSTLFHFAIIS